MQEARWIMPFNQDHTDAYAPELIDKPCINCAGILRDDPAWQAKMHFHAHVTELQYIVDGHGIVTVDGVSYAAGPGDLLIFHSREVHKDDFRRSETPVFSYFLRFHEYRVGGLEKDRLLPRGVSPVLNAQDISGQLLFYFENIYDECERQAPGFEAIVDNYLTALILLILRVTASGSAGSLPKQDSLALEIKQYMDANLFGPLSVPIIAKSLGISIYHLMHVFRNEMGIAPMRYLTGRRIVEAKKMLSNSSLAINEIAQRIGYESASHFNTQFKRLAGLTPGQYRRSNRGVDDFHDAKVEKPC